MSAKSSGESSSSEEDRRCNRSAGWGSFSGRSTGDMDRRLCIRLFVGGDLKGVEVSGLWPLVESGGRMVDVEGGEGRETEDVEGCGEMADVAGGCG